MKRLKQALVILLIIIVVLQIVPFLVPLSEYAGTPTIKPFENSYFYEENGEVVHYRLWPPAIAESTSPYGDAVGKILFVHGMGASTSSFDSNIPAFTEAGYIVVAVDLPGFGYSIRGENLDHSQQHRAELLWKLLNTIDGSAEASIAEMPWHLAGHSMGGGTVSTMATQNPSRAASLLLIDGALSDAGRPEVPILSYPPLARWVMVAMEHVFITENRIESLLMSAYGRKPTDLEVQRYLIPLQQPGTARGAINFVKTSKGTPLTELTKYPGPVLSVWGADDEWVPLSELTAITPFLPQLKTEIISGAGHVPHETHSDLFNVSVLKWLEINR